MKSRNTFAPFLLTTAIIAICGCSKMLDIEPEQLPQHKNSFIAGAALETIITGVKLNEENTVHFDSLGGVYYHSQRAIRGLTWEGTDTSIKLEDIKYIHVASCDTTQCVAYSMDVPSLRAKDRLWQVRDDDGKVPPVELVEFDAAGGTYDEVNQRVIARTRRGQQVEFWLSHIRYLRVEGLEQGTRTSEIRLRGSLGLTSLTGGDSQIASTEKTSRADFSAGLVARQWLRPKFCLQVEANLSRLSGERTWILAEADTTLTVVDRIKLTRLEIPILARLQVLRRNDLAAHLYTGGCLSFNLEAVTEFDSTKSIAGFDFRTYGTAKIANPCDATLGVILGCDIEYPVLGMNTSLDIRYTLGLTSLLTKYGEPYDLEDNYRPLEDESGGPLDFKMNHLSASVGIRLF